MPINTYSPYLYSTHPINSSSQIVLPIHWVNSPYLSLSIGDYWDPLDEAEYVIKRLLDAVTETAKAAIALYQQQHPTRAAAGGDGDGMALALASDQLYEILVAIKRGRYDDRHIIDSTPTTTSTTGTTASTTAAGNGISAVGNGSSTLGNGSSTNEGSMQRLESLAVDTREIFRQAEASLVDSKTESGQDQCEVGDPFTLQYSRLIATFLTFLFLKYFLPSFLLT